MIKLQTFIHIWKPGRALLISSPGSPLLQLTFVKSLYSGAKQGMKRVKSAPLQERKMVDKFHLCVKGGHGGDGCTSFLKSRHACYGSANGGNGGRGGDTILECSPRVWDFSHLQHHANAKKGGKGSSKRMVGSRGADKIIQVPVGTVLHLVSGCIPSLAHTASPSSKTLWEESDHILSEHNECRPCKNKLAMETENKGRICQRPEAYSLHNRSLCSILSSEENLKEDHSCETMTDCCDNTERGEEVNHSYCTLSNSEEEEHQDWLDDDIVDNTPRQILQFSVAELTSPGQRLIVACGGEGGRGNASMARGRGSQKSLPSREHESGYPGTQAFLVLELKTIADVGLVGAPNSGKSTLLGALSRAKPRIGHYAFTTLRPNLGQLEYEDFFSLTVADIPGLIKGAHENRGLGHEFLRHIERTMALAYVVDLSTGLRDRNGISPWDQLEELKFELEKYQPGLSRRPSLVVANKIDEDGTDEVLKELRYRLPSTHIFPVCAVLEEGISELRMGIRELVEGSSKNNV